MKALVVDDDPSHRLQICTFLGDIGVQASMAGGFREGLELGLRLRPELLVVDWRLGEDLHGIALVRILKALVGPLHAILVSGYLNAALLEEAEVAGTDHFLDKPFEAIDLHKAVRMATDAAPKATGTPLAFFEFDADGNCLHQNPAADGFVLGTPGTGRMPLAADLFEENLLGLPMTGGKLRARLSRIGNRVGPFDAFVLGAPGGMEKTVIVVDEPSGNTLESAILHHVFSEDAGRRSGKAHTRTVLVVLSAASRRNTERKLLSAGFNAVCVHSLAQAERMLETIHRVEFVVVEMPFAEGVHVLLPQSLDGRTCDRGDVPPHSRLESGSTPRAHLPEDWRVVHLLEAVHAMGHKLLRDRSLHIVGSSDAMRRLREDVRLAARTNLNVLILGETGAGKELTSRALHALSERAACPLHTVNCAALPEDGPLPEYLAERLHAADAAECDSQAILFLDEIGELSPRNQARLFRLAETGAGLLPGCTGMRIIGATALNLQEMVNDGRFRMDLYYRIAGTEIRLPPLREHVEDIPELVRHILDLAGNPDTVVEDEALDVLCGMDWPGNVRELQNCLLRAAGSSAGRRLGLAAFGSLTATASTRRMWKSLKDIERQHIERVLAACGGNVTQAAKILGVSRMTLYNKLK